MKAHINIRHYLLYVLLCTEIWALTNSLVPFLIPPYGISFIHAPIILGSFIGGLSFAFSYSRFYQNKLRSYLGLFIIISLFSTAIVFAIAWINAYQTDLINNFHINLWSHRMVLTNAMRFKYAAITAFSGSIVPNIIWCLTLRILNSTEEKIYFSLKMLFILLFFYIIVFLIAIKWHGFQTFTNVNNIIFPTQPIS